MTWTPSSDRCDGECMCRLNWESPVEDLVDAIERLPEGVCIEHEGVCKRVPCCKDRPGETADPGW